MRYIEEEKTVTEAGSSAVKYRTRNRESPCSKPF